MLICSCAFDFFGTRKGALYSLFHACRIKYLFCLMLTAGSNGEVKAIPKDFTLDNIETYTNMPIEIPKKPAI